MENFEMPIQNETMIKGIKPINDSTSFPARSSLAITVCSHSQHDPELDV